MKRFIYSIMFLFFICNINGQNVGIGTNTPSAKLDVNGDMILQSRELVIPDGTIYQLDVNTSKFNNYKLTGPTGNFQIAGIAAAENDRTVALFNRTGVSMEVYNDDANAILQDRILTGTGGTFAVYNGGNVVLKYDATISRWEIISSHYNSLDNFGSAWAGNANDIYNTNTGNVGVGTNTPLEKLSVAGNVDISGDIKMSGIGGQAGDVLQNNGNGTMTWTAMTQNQNGNVGFGTWGCDMDNLTSYQPIVNDDLSSAYFGLDSDIHDDRAIICAPASTINGNQEQGCAYIYELVNEIWVQKQKITASDGIAFDHFGTSAVIYENHALVTAGSASVNNQPGAGSVYVFNFNGTEWIQTQKIVDENNGPLFGSSLSISGNRLAIGETGENNFTGAVHTYLFDGASWLPEQLIHPFSGANNDYFGNSVDMDGDEMIVGAPFDDDNLVDQGSVYFFHYDGSMWQQQTKYFSPGAGSNAKFGTTVSLSGDNAITGRFQNLITFFKLINGSWYMQRSLSNPGFTYPAISGSHALVASGKIFKQTNQSWILYETAGDPQGTAQGTTFYSGAIDNGRFVICAPEAINQSGMAIFGKIKD